MLATKEETLSPVDEDRCWEHALSRDTTMDGVFYVAVRTTGVYCRPSCPGKRPKRENVTFFASWQEAETAGFRACKRCRPKDPAADRRPDLVQAASQHLENDPEPDTSLVSVSERLSVGAEYLRRLFKRTLGVTPREYAQAHRVERLKEHLRDGAPVTRALYDAGYPSSNRLYESAGSQLGMTPGAYRRGGEGMTITYQVTECSLGWLLVGATERGVCSVNLGDSPERLEHSLAREYPKAEVQPGMSPWIRPVLDYLDGRRVRLDLPIDVQATAFQIRVWRALQDIAYGKTKAYSEVARDIGMPRATRAVARACATNPVALIIPCHRVVRSNGDLGGYGAGVERKQALLAMESGLAERQERSTGRTATPA